jgi:hypothetical protein
MNAPAATTCAMVIFAFESENAARDSHEAARDGAIESNPSIAAREALKRKPRQHLELVWKGIDAPRDDLTFFDGTASGIILQVT